MKFSDLMLDLATGDVTQFDPYIAEADGKVKISSAYTEAAVQINELAENGGLTNEIVQELAKSELPTDAVGSAALADTAAKNAVMGIYDVVGNSVKKVLSRTETGMKALNTVAKKYGVPSASSAANYEDDFVKPFVKAVFEKKGEKTISIGDRKFLKGKYADELASNYVKGICSYLHAYGYDVSSIANDPTIKKICPSVKKGKVETFNALVSAISDGSKLIKFDKINEEAHYTSEVTKGDLEDLLTAFYTVYVSSKAFDKAMTGNKQSAEANVKALFGSKCSDKVCKSVKKIGDNSTEWSASARNMSTAMIKGLSDSVYSFVEAIKG